MGQALSTRDLIHQDIHYAFEGWTIQKLAEFLSEHEISGAPVVGKDFAIKGMVTSRDVMRFEGMSCQEKLALIHQSEHTEWLGQEFTEQDLKNFSQSADQHITVASIMNSAVLCADVETPPIELAKLMDEKHMHRLMMTENDKFVGVLTSSDLVHWMATDRMS